MGAAGGRADDGASASLLVTAGRDSPRKSRPGKQQLRRAGSAASPQLSSRRPVSGNGPLFLPTAGHICVCTSNATEPLQGACVRARVFVVFFFWRSPHILQLSCQERSTTLRLLCRKSALRTTITVTNKRARACVKPVNRRHSAVWLFILFPVAPPPFPNQSSKHSFRAEFHQMCNNSIFGCIVWGHKRSIPSNLWGWPG